MSSFYGRDISKPEAEEVTSNHIIFSKTEPTVQKAGDIWVVIGEFADRDTDNDSEEGEENTGG